MLTPSERFDVALKNPLRLHWRKANDSFAEGHSVRLFYADTESGDQVWYGSEFYDSDSESPEVFIQSMQHFFNLLQAVRDSKNPS